MDYVGLVCYCIHSVYRAVTEKQVLNTIRTAHQFGGSFMSKVADAALSADPRNRSRLLDAFPELIAKYGPGSAFYTEQF